MTMTDETARQAHLLHQLRNHLNLIGLALHAYRSDGQPRHLEVVEDSCSAAGELLERFGRPPSAMGDASGDLPG